MVMRGVSEVATGVKLECTKLVVPLVSKVVVKSITLLRGILLR
ncbi:MAG: hypothetical protein KatS3mg087_1751 [Patescibacteria group bacterium]|nr:MAG: hypothetical protein KatS3mg087_1751 [Patescibacteria group bacterium]